MADGGDTEEPEKQKFTTILVRSLRLRCPVCGGGKMFRGLLRMNEACAQCGLRYGRDSGYFLGSIYVNYGLTALIVTIVYPSLLFSQAVPNETLLWYMLGFSVAFPIWFFRYSRSIWAGFDQYFDPWSGTNDTKTEQLSDDSKSRE